MSTENFDNFYNDVVAALRVSLLQVSSETWTPWSPEDHAKLDEIFRSTNRGMIPFSPREPELKTLRESLPPVQPSYAGFQLVDVTRLGDFALIAFRWRETGDEIFVHTVDLRPFAAGPYDVLTTEAIVTTNLLERLGGKWYEQRTLRRIKGLTFVE